ncbi:MAG: type II toxin-antitoxin system VapC family toxin [Pseudomonadales bacterium]|nr:type II toxin-antitoxin system VapC family toxin [Pseudomonadales bacterium]
MWEIADELSRRIAARAPLKDVVEVYIASGGEQNTAMTIVLDSSAMLAYLFEETGWQVVQDAMADAIVCSVDLAEVVGKLVDPGYDASETRQLVSGFVALTVPHAFGDAFSAGSLLAPTRQPGLSLGDRCCLALAMDRQARVLTADRA